jgi:WD40 repeat protein
LQHPHIVAVFDSGQDGGHHYIASAFIAGRSLHAVLEEMPSGQTLELRQAVQIVRKVAEALAYAHRQGVVHRDVKCGNVMLRDDGEPLLMDFGLAARHDETEKLTVAGQFLGTPEYAAPEQWRGEAQAASDQYSLGCLLFELLTGEKPFSGSSSEHYLMLHTTQPAPSPRKFRPDLPRDLETICLKCLEKEPARRYSDCQALADDLRRWQEGAPVQARPPGPIERLDKWARRSPAVAALTVLAALLLMAGMVVSTVLYLRAEEKARFASDKADEAERERTNAEGSARREKDLAGKEAAARANAERELAKAEFVAYAFRLRVAQDEIEHGQWDKAKAVLNLCDPKLRGWEYGYLLRQTQRCLWTGRHTDAVSSVAFSSDGKRIASGGWDRMVKVWDTLTGKEALSLTGHTDKVTSVTFSPNGRRIVSGSFDKTVKVWDALTGKEALALTGHTDAVSSVAFSPDGKRIALGSLMRTVKVWDVQTVMEALSLKGHTSRVHSVAISSDGKRIVSGSGNLSQLHKPVVEVKVWDAQTGKEALSLTGHTDEVRSVAFSPDGRRIASGSTDRTVKVWDALTGKEALSLTGHTDMVSSVAFSPDGRRIASGSDDGTVKVWDALTGKEVLSLPTDPDMVTSVAFSPDGRRIVSGTFDNTVKVWDTLTGKEVLSLTGHTDRVFSVAFSPDGRRIASGSTDRTVKVWDTLTGKEVLSLTGHTEGVSSVAFSPNTVQSHIGRFLDG